MMKCNVFLVLRKWSVKKTAGEEWRQNEQGVVLYSLPVIAG